MTIKDSSTKCLLCSCVLIMSCFINCLTCLTCQKQNKSKTGLS